MPLARVSDNFLEDSPWIDNVARQAIINGNFDVAQRAKSATNWPDVYATVDRWRTDTNLSIKANMTWSQKNLSPGEIPGSNFYMELNNTLAAPAPNPANNDVFLFQQAIENGPQYLCGEGKKVTLSFWAKSSIAGKKLGTYLMQGYGSGGSPSEDIVGTAFALTNSWTKYKYTFTTNTLVGKTFGPSNDAVLSLVFCMLYSGSKATLVGASGTVEGFGVGSVSIAQVQLCAGDIALPFQPRSFAEELALCQRYYQQHSTNSVNQYDLRPTMRVNPTVTGTSSPYAYDAEL